ncbi:MAG TPA: hypothetical protein VFV07_06205 [Rhizomicrobium sp.]|nr:hypothetical protein [Rhizomicrobium sp.]
MKKRLAILSLAGSVAIVSPSYAGTAAAVNSIKTTQGLRAACDSSEGSAELHDCLVYIKGVADMMRLIGVEATDPNTSPERDLGMLPFSACNLPEENEIRIAFLKWSRKNPALLKVDPVVGVWQAISFGWHCAVKRDFDVLPH